MLDDDDEGSGSGDDRPSYLRTPAQQADYDRQTMAVSTVAKLITLEGLERTEYQLRRPRDLRKLFVSPLNMKIHLLTFLVKT